MLGGNAFSQDSSALSVFELTKSFPKELYLSLSQAG